MFRTASRSLLVVALAAVPVLAQKSLVGHSMAGEIATTGHLVVAMDGKEFSGLAGTAFLTYTPAVWKAAYADQARLDEATKGHLFRLGMNNWATIDTSVPMVFGNVTVPAGIWYLGIARDQGGSTWTLVFVDPAKAKAQGIIPPMADKAPRAHEVPLTIEKNVDTAATMKVTLTADEKEPTKGVFSIAFGNMKTAVQYELKTAPVAEAGSKKG